MSEVNKKPAGFIKKLFTNNIYMNSTFMMGITFLGGIINLAFTIIIGGMLGPEKYGIVISLISLSILIGLPSRALMYVMTNDFSQLVHGQKIKILKKLLRIYVKWTLVFNVVLVGLLFVLLPFIKNYLHVSENLGFFIVFVYLFIATLSGPFNSLIQSRERFFPAGIGQLMNVVIKFVVGFFLVKATTEYFGALWGILAGSVSVLLILCIDLFSLKNQSKDAKYDAKEWDDMVDYKRFFKSFFYAFLTVGALQFITNLDILLVRHFLPDESGVYGAAAQIGKASFFIATGVSFVLLPKMSKIVKDRDKNNIRGLIFLFLILGVYALAIYFLRDFIADYKFFYKGLYPGLSELLPFYTLMFIPYAGISYLVNFYFLTKNLVYSYTIVAGAALLILGIYLFHSTPQQVTFVLGVIGYLVFIVLLLDSFILKKLGKNKVIPVKSVK